MTELSRRDALVMGTAGLIAPCAALAASPAGAALAPLAHSIEESVPGLKAEPLAAVRRIQAQLIAAADRGAFALWRGATPSTAEKTTLLRGGSPGKNWKVQLFLIPEGISHPPHCHENLASCQLVLEGRLRMREYQRLREYDTEDAVALTPAFDGELGPRQAIATTEDYRNAHWFGAIGGAVLAVNFKASGYVRPELLRLANRRYVDPSAASPGVFRAPFIDRAAAHRRFAQRLF